MSHGAGTEVSISERRHAGGHCYLLKASTHLGLPNWQWIRGLFLWRLLVHETFKEDKRSTQTQRFRYLITLCCCFFCATQAILRVAEHQAGVRKPKARGSCVQERLCWGARHALVTMVVMLIYIDGYNPHKHEMDAKDWLQLHAIA